MDQRVASHETSELIGSDRVEGTSVYNRAGDRLGSIDTVMIGKRSGQVAYAVMSFGGFLGIGENHYPLPWEMLTYDTDKDGYVVDLTKDRLKDAPSYAREAEPAYDESYRRGVNSYYGVVPPTAGL